MPVEWCGGSGYKPPREKIMKGKFSATKKSALESRYRRRNIKLVFVDA